MHISDRDDLFVFKIQPPGFESNLELKDVDLLSVQRNFNLSYKKHEKWASS
jgi:hypothetical protein